MARLAGSVQGVVVQMTAKVRSGGSPAGNRSSCPGARAKATWTVGEVCSWYSTSASASAVLQWMHHCTDFMPL